ncbi:MAG: Gfo/Idh/MocA family oxidoreductase [Alicyclobacillus herbarius]|uniref:Gfo/Idh/MocA family protein n=1 Tax=Alicyclobacillus herbarius TaxID=122960 RepID=UPI0023537A32|nr:Gfo/Idh/MocA family oxidoreductase [Alicyclobacillus herbarius]MCL6631326.1 Gfo/Idh/MocA family oxidoreductase [Alicyclobacillus herbarius]
MEPVKVGIIGCGNISSIYLRNLSAFSGVDVVAVADLDMVRARAKAEEFGVTKACTVEELLADKDIELVVNLTIPKAHAEVALAALEQGKHVYSEKPLAVHLEDGQKVLATARARGLRVGCAPDTFLGGGLQTCRKLLDDGWIGTPVAATAFMMSHGHESWHPDPAFFYQMGGGPMFDMGPYYLTALVHLLGPIRRVTGSARITFPERIVTSKPRRGERIRVETPTHIAGVLDFQNGAIATLVTSFDVWYADVPRIEIYGTEGSMSVPDPNHFSGPVRIRRPGVESWSEIPILSPFVENSRGLGVANMALAIRSGDVHLAHGDLAYHVLEAMHGFHLASEQGRHYDMQSTCERPAPFSAETVQDLRT